MKSRIQILGFLYVFLIGIPLGAQTPFYINYDTNNGLPSPEVYNIHFTNDNKAWFTTDRGIASYNGYEFTTYSTEDGLSNNTNFNIFEDSNNQLWFTGIDGSVSIMKNGKFIQKPFLDSLKLKSNKKFYYLPIENSQGQVLLFNRMTDFATKFFVIYDPKNQTFEKLESKAFQQKYSFQQGSKIHLAKFGKCVMAFSKEIMFFKPLIEHHNNWVGASYNELYKIDQKGEVIQTANLNDKIDFWYIDGVGDLWIGTNNGLYLYDNANLNSTPKHYSPSIKISDLKEDFEGNYWMATGDQGVFFIPDPKINTINFKNKYFSNARILSIGALDQRIYFGSSLGKIFSVDKNFKVDTIIKPDNTKRNNNNAYKLNNKIFFRNQIIAEDKNGKIKLQKNTIFTTNFIAKELSNGDLFSIDNTGHLLQKKVGDLISFIDLEQPFDSRIECIEEDKTGKIWFGTHNGLYFMNSNLDNTIFKATFDHKMTTQRINDIKLDLHENLWIGSVGNGLTYKTSDSTYHITAKDGLQSNLLNCIFVQDSNTVWVGTNQGLNLIKYNYENNILSIDNIYKYGVLDGLLSNFINDIKIWNGYIWLATNKGIVYIKPESLKLNSPLVPIYLEHFKVNEEFRTPENGITLKAKDNDIFLQMTGISYRKKVTNEFYRYRLLEANKESAWKYTRDRNIQFIDLQPGSYTFEAAAKNKSEKWSDPPIQLKFKIEPYFTQTLLFKILLGALVLSIFALLFIFRDKQLKRRNTLQQNYMNVKMKAKEYELSALRNQMNPHFVFNSLNAIQSFIFKSDKIKANYYLSKFSKLMRDSLHFSRLKYIGLHEEIRFLETYLELEQMRFPDAFDFSIDIDKDIPTKQYEIPSLLFQPVLENVVKHAFKGLEYKGIISIKIKDNIPGRSLSVVIQDNGKGFAGDFFEDNGTSNQYKSLGLTIVKNQIDALNLEMEDNYASFSISNLANIDTDKSGVVVSFIIPVKSVLSDLSNITMKANPIN